MAEQLINSSEVWRTAGGDSTRRGLFDRAVQLDPRPSRHLSAEGAVLASVIFDEQGRVFVADMAGTVQAFRGSGDRLWRARLPGGISATPALSTAKPRLFVGTHTGWLCALDTADGSINWRREIPTKSDPRILSDLLYLPQVDAVVLHSWGGRFYALEANSGAERFSWDAGISPQAAAAASRAGDIYCLRAVARQGVELVRVNARGEESVVHRTPEGKRGARRTLVAAAPVLDEERGVVYFVVNQDQGSSLLAWSLTSGALLWSHELPNSVQGTPALRKQGAVLLADLAGIVHGIGPDGTALFQYASGCEYLVAGGVCEAGGASFLGDPLGMLHAIDGQGQGQTIFEATRSIQARASFGPDGSLHVPCTDRKVYVFTGRGV